MDKLNTQTKEFSYPLTFGSEDLEKWRSLKPGFEKAVSKLASQPFYKYEQLRKAVETHFKRNPVTLPYPVLSDDDAKEILDVIFLAEENLIRKKADQEEVFRKTGRRVREYFSDHLLELHLSFLDEHLDKSEKALQELAVIYPLDGVNATPKALQRLKAKFSTYRGIGAFVHMNELSLSAVKIKKRAAARAARGNLWHTERREKYAYLEDLADGNNVCPPFTEADLEFLVSQSSLDMLKKKTDLLLSEIGFVEPNRLKANYSRLKEQLRRSRQRNSDYESRKELLLKLGASPQQIEYISARATFQTMQNLLRLSDGELAISDLMGGKRTIAKLLRRNGRAVSKTEEEIVDFLSAKTGISRKVAERYAKTRKNHSKRHLLSTINFLKENYAQFYKEHWGFPIKPDVLKSALEIGFSKQKLNKRSMTKKDFLRDLRRAVSVEEASVVKQHQKIKLTPDDRRKALDPLREVLGYETDTDTRKQLFFIYEQFCQHGICISKEQLKKNCLKNKGLFPTPRKVQDALEILNGAYRAIGQDGESICVLPDYLQGQSAN